MAEKAQMKSLGLLFDTFWDTFSGHFLIPCPGQRRHRCSHRGCWVSWASSQWPAEKLKVLETWILASKGGNLLISHVEHKLNSSVNFNVKRAAKVWEVSVLNIYVILLDSTLYSLVKVAVMVISYRQGPSRRSLQLVWVNGDDCGFWSWKVRLAPSNYPAQLLL